ncbi:MAG: hypothetical protein IJ647_01575 [Prevotella sp.]|nr:hypothetical protein [Prevotella sp.]
MIRLIIKVELKKAARSLEKIARESLRAERELASLSTLNYRAQLATASTL